MFRSLKSRILIGILGIVFLITFSILYLVRITVKNEILTAQYENASNLVNTILLHVDNGYQNILLQKEASLERRKTELMNIIDLAYILVEESYGRYEAGVVSLEEAEQSAVDALRRFRYEEGAGYIWINDTGEPYPRMIMHPIMPELEGTVMDDPEYNTAKGTGKNLFTVFTDLCRESGAGFAEYKWPDRDGVRKAKLSYVRLFEEWDWIIGTGVFIDDLEEDVQKWIDAVLREQRETFSKVRIAETGYLYIFDGSYTFLVHPNLEGEDISLLINPGTGSVLADDLIRASETPDIPYEYLWDKPGVVGDYRFRKQAYVTYFEPLDWYIASSLYLDEIEEPVRRVERQILLLSLLFLCAAVFLSFFLSGNLTKSLRKLTAAAEEIKIKGPRDTEIPVSGTEETRELGLILGSMINSIRKTAEQLQQAQKMDTVGTLAGGLAHDFNNMLGGILGTLTIMEFNLQADGYIPKDTLDENLETIHECSLRAANMVQQLLSLSRKQEVCFEQADVNRMVRHVMNICENSFDKSVRISPRYLDAPGVVRADPTQIEQALLNICINAEHAMTFMRPPEETWGGDLDVTVDVITADAHFCALHPGSREGTYYSLSMKDSGIGMKEDMVKNIFDPFYTTKKKGEGSGLGLSMVYNIVRQHDGFINVYSEPGVGTVFHLYLPVPGDDQMSELDRAVTKAPPKGEGLILVVDDEPAVRRTAAGILKSCGYRVLLANNGKDGLRIFRNSFGEIRAVLLDMVMPEMSGREVFLKLKEIDPECRVILTSGFRYDDRVEEVIQMGVEGFIRKPYTLEMLAEAVHRVLNEEASP